MEKYQDEIELDLNEIDCDALIARVELVEHDNRWKEWAAEELAHLKDLLGDICLETHHIGSTAIEKIISKPIIDLLVEVPEDFSYEEMRKILESDGYTYLSHVQIHQYKQGQMGFCKGFLPKPTSERQFFLHVHRVGDMLEAVFRDYLNRHEDVARRYEQLKIRSAEINRDNYGDYSDSKGRFVCRIYDEAIMELVDVDPEEAKKISPRLFPISYEQIFRSAGSNTEILDPFGRSTGLKFVSIPHD